MKKFTAITAAMLLAMSCALVTACTSSNDNNTTTASSAEATTEAKNPEQTTGAKETTEAVTTTEAPAETTVADVTTAVIEDNLVTLRIEGIESNIYYGKVALDAYDCTVYDVLLLAKAEGVITIDAPDTGYGPYLTTVNDVTAGKFGGWDGWMYLVNDTDPGVGMSECYAKGGDVIVFYYADPYGIGFQYPEVSYQDGALTFTSTDVTYDAAGTPTSTVNPVAGATVTFDGETYVTDETGTVTLTKEAATDGMHTLAIEKIAETGCPMVLRFAPDYQIEIKN